MTGGTSGLGLHAALRLLASDEQLRLVVGTQRPDRDSPLSVAASRAGHGARLVLLPLNLASLASVARFANLAKDTHEPPLTSVIANAGVQYGDAVHRTEDGFEATFGVNVIGHFALMKALGVTERAWRVVLTSSGTHHDLHRYRFGYPRPQWRTPDQLARGDGGPRRMAGPVAYSTSKLAIVYLGHELARRMPDGGSVTVFDPGLVPGTGLVSRVSKTGQILWQTVAPVMRVLPNVTSPTRAGDNLARLLDAVDTGQYVAVNRVIRSSRESYDEVRERDLWTYLDKLVQ